MLSADIDELFHSYSMRSIFDATIESPRGYLRAAAEWVFPQVDETKKLLRHKDHMLVSADANAKTNLKWCVDPNGPQSGKQWRTHFIDRNDDYIDPDFRMWHFHSVSTNWKPDRANGQEQLVEDSVLSNVMSQAFD